MNSGFPKHDSFCGFWLGAGLALVLLLAVPAVAQSTHSGPVSVDNEETPLALPVQPTAAERPAPAHRFWDRENLWLFAGVAAFRNLDYASTYNMLRRGREEILLPNDVVQTHAGFMAVESAGTASSIGLSYLLHRTGHHKLERWLSIGHISVAGFGAVRNYCLQTKH
jgi:hypothetical protein